MKYNSIVKATFLKRPNRFIAHVIVDGKETIAHIPNTGRCRELLVAGCTVYLDIASNPNRKTQYTLIAVEKVMSNGEIKIVNMDSSAPNNLVEEWLLAGNLFGADCHIKREVTYKDSRFDFYVEYDHKKAYIEVKGVTLEMDGVAMFPDAPTERGLKHVFELCDCVNNGYEGYIIFVVKMGGCEYFAPNEKTHSAFAEGLRFALANGVNIMALECTVADDRLEISKELKLKI